MSGDILDDIDGVISDWRGSVDAASWSDVGDEDPEPWARPIDSYYSAESLRPTLNIAAAAEAAETFLRELSQRMQRVVFASSDWSMFGPSLHPPRPDDDYAPAIADYAADRLAWRGVFGGSGKPEPFELKVRGLDRPVLTEVGPAWYRFTSPKATAG